MPKHINFFCFAGDSVVAIENLLLKGKREKAVEVAIEHGHFDMAFLVASRCSQQTYQYVAKRFTERSLPIDSPLHTVSMLYAGQLQPQPKGAQVDTHSSCWGGDPEELRRMWKKHTAAIISNRAPDWDRIVVSLGNRLKQLGEISAAHFCYMVGGSPVSGPSSRKTLSLLGCNVDMNDITLSTKISIEDSVCSSACA